jgi:hypothetical protein
MDKTELLQKIGELRKSLKPTRVRKIEQLKGIERLLNTKFVIPCSEEQLYEFLKETYNGTFPGIIPKEDIT